MKKNIFILCKTKKQLSILASLVVAFVIGFVAIKSVSGDNREIAIIAIGVVGIYLQSEEWKEKTIKFYKKTIYLFAGFFLIWLFGSKIYYNYLKVVEESNTLPEPTR